MMAQNACAGQIPVEPVVILTQTPKLFPSKTLYPTFFYNSLTPSLPYNYWEHITPDPTDNAAQKAWRATALMIHNTEQAVTQIYMDAQETKIAQFPSACDSKGTNRDGVSPDGKWLATICKDEINIYNRNLIVQNKDGAKWLLNFEDFLSPDSPKDMWGSLSPEFWSLDGKYLFFTNGLGYSGGGDYCFPSNFDWGEYGLFRLNLNSGQWTTFIPPTDYFPGYEIEFSPTGRYYAATKDMVEITDLLTGKIAKIATDGQVQRMRWSSDGKYLAYSTANCGEYFEILNSSIYIWDATNNRMQSFFSLDGIKLEPESWIDSRTIRINGMEFKDSDFYYTIFEYNIEAKNLLLRGTETPSP